EGIAERIVAEGLGSPLLVIVGAVVAFGERLSALVAPQDTAAAAATETRRATPRLVAG
ncbi:MAG: hypothetical protein JNK67_17730, partial [Alphaproteobacteria bacterium]|nr:hypothetical protein [Alphaproteobacteria bacterium]